MEFFYSTLGERRLGCVDVDMPAGITSDANMQAVTFKYRHLPTNDEADAELWVLAQKLDGSDSELWRRTASGWTEIAWPDAPVATGLIPMQMQTLHGKLFVAYPSAVDRLHVWDGTTLRRTGIGEPVAPVVSQAAAASSDYETEVLSDNPTGYWRLEEATGNFVDSSGAGRDMTVTLNGGTGLVYHVPGAIASAGFGVQYNQGDFYPGLIEIVTSTTPAPMWGAAADGSIDFWVRPNAGTFDPVFSLPHKTIVSSSDAVTQASVGLFLDFPSGTVRLEYINEAGQAFYNTTPLEQDRTYHCALVVDNAAGGTWYVNGVADGTFTGADAMDANQLLDRNDFMSQGIVGVVDEIAVYNTALSAATVLSHYNIGVRAAVGTHNYRVRFTTQVGGVTVRRSEPSESASLVVIASNNQVQISRPALPGEGETHWEIEASVPGPIGEDSGTYYVIATLPIATTSFSDNVPVETYSTLDLSEDIGTYGLIPSVRWLAVDNDRLLPCGSFEEPTEESRVRWTPVGGDPSPGQDERLNLTTEPELDLDGQEGGDLSGVSRAIYGYAFAFKRGHIYKLVRTGRLIGAYEAIPITKARGALPLSLIEASDQSGRPALYFTDPQVGPMRMGSEGLQACGFDIQTNEWSRVNTSAERPIHGVYYPAKLQIHWWVALDGAETPNAKFVLQTNEMRSDAGLGARRGWSTVPVDDVIATAYCSCMFAPNVDSADPRTQTLVPLIGMSAANDYILRCDTGVDDNGTAYRASIKTRPLFFGGLMNLHGVMAVTLLADAMAGDLLVTLVPDFGRTPVQAFVADLTPFGSETVVAVAMDDCSLSSLRAVQILIEDRDVHVSWRIHQLALKYQQEDKA